MSGFINPYFGPSSVQINVSQVFGNDNNNSSLAAPVATIRQALILAGSPSVPTVINILDGARYDEQATISVPNIHFYAPFAVWDFSGAGDTLTLNPGANSILYLGVLGNSGGGKSIVNNTNTFIILNVLAIPNGDVLNTNNGVILINGTDFSTVDFLNTGGGEIIYNCLFRGGADDPGVIGTNAQGASGNFTIQGGLNASGLSYPAVDGTFGQVMTTDGAGNLTLQNIIFPIGAVTLINSPALTSVNLAGGADVTILPAGSPSATYQLSNIVLNGGGATNFSGLGGNRNLTITDGTSVYTIIPSATLLTLFNTNWGSTGMPYPISIPVSQPTVAGASIFATYSGGTGDYSAGSVTITLEYEQLTL